MFWLYKRRNRRTLVFLSLAGTCRDAMAKAITTKLLEKQPLKYPVDVRAAGLGPVDDLEASYAARFVIKEMYGEDLLADHRPELLTTALADKADVILAMDRSLLESKKTSLKGWPHDYKKKAYLLKQFFHSDGDVIDPYPDGRDPDTLMKYRKCAEELRQILTRNLDQLVKALQL
jgi:protein-tyrosine-phosphatase